MRRRYVAALAVITPVILISVLQHYYPLSYKVLSGYMVAVAIVFKTALLTFWKASKLKIIAFLKGLTLFQGSTLLIKRWFLDNVFAKWLKRNITDHIMVGIRELVAYYRALNFKAKFKNIFLPLVVSLISAWALYTSGYLNHLLLFTEFKVLVIALSKTLLSMGTQLFGFLANSWITPILEVFALSYIFSWLERVLGTKNPLIRALNWIGEQLNRLIFFFGDLNKKHIDPLLNDHVAKQSQGISSWISGYVRHKKISYEYEQFEKFEQRLLQAHINAYYHVKGMEKITDKRALYALINQKTDDNLDIVAFVSRNSKGELLPEAVEDSFYHDLFILEGIASSHRHGIRQEQDRDPDHSDFWVLNTSRYPALLASHSGQVPVTDIPSHSIQLIKTGHPQDYDMGDIYVSYHGRTETVIPVAPHH